MGNAGCSRKDTDFHGEDNSGRKAHVINCRAAKRSRQCLPESQSQHTNHNLIRFYHGPGAYLCREGLCAQSPATSRVKTARSKKLPVQAPRKPPRSRPSGDGCRVPCAGICRHSRCALDHGQAYRVWGVPGAFLGAWTGSFFASGRFTAEVRVTARTSPSRGKVSARP